MVYFRSTVTLQSVGQNVAEFTGFICQARRADGQTFPVGSFGIPNPSDHRLLNCALPQNFQSSAAGTITNVNSDPKLLPVTFPYTAPSDLGRQDIIFM